MSYNLFHLVTLFFGFYLLALLPLVKGALYVVTPSAQSTCRGGQKCTVSWLDDGSSPLLTAIGVSNVGLYTGKQQLVQALPPVDVSSTLSFTFTPNQAAGPNSGAYYIAFTSTKAKVNGTLSYVSYSPWFSLEGMTGSFDSPLPSATQSIPIPSSLTLQPPSTTILSTITVGTLSTAIPSPPVSSSSHSATPSSSPSASPSASLSSSSSSRFSTSVRPSSTSTIPSTSSTTAASSGSPNSTNGASGSIGKPLSYLSICIAFTIAVALG